MSYKADKKEKINDLIDEHSLNYPKSFLITDIINIVLIALLILFIFIYFYKDGRGDGNNIFSLLNEIKYYVNFSDKHITNTNYYVDPPLIAFKLTFYIGIAFIPILLLLILIKSLKILYKDKKYEVLNGFFLMLYYLTYFAYIGFNALTFIYFYINGYPVTLSFGFYSTLIISFVLMFTIFINEIRFDLALNKITLTMSDEEILARFNDKVKLSKKIEKPKVEEIKYKTKNIKKKELDINLTEFDTISKKEKKVTSEEKATSLDLQVYDIEPKMIVKKNVKVEEPKVEIIKEKPIIKKEEKKEFDKETIEKLNKLKALKEDNLISEEEYRKMMDKIIGL